MWEELESGRVLAQPREAEEEEQEECYQPTWERGSYKAAFVFLNVFLNQLSICSRQYQLFMRCAVNLARSW